MEKIKEIVADLMECYDGTGTPNQHYIKNKVTELHNIVKNINYDTVLAPVICDWCEKDITNKSKICADCADRMNEH